MKAKIVLRRAWVKHLSKPSAFILAPEYYESADDARANYHDHFLGLDISTEIVIEIAAEENRIREESKGMILPESAYGGSE